MTKRELNTEKLSKVLAVLFIPLFPILVFINPDSYGLFIGVFVFYAVSIFFIDIDILWDSTFKIYVSAIIMFIIVWFSVVAQFQGTSETNVVQKSGLMFVRGNYSIVDRNSSELIVSYNNRDNKEGYFEYGLFYEKNGYLNISTKCYTNWFYQDEVTCDVELVK